VEKERKKEEERERKKERTREKEEERKKKERREKERGREKVKRRDSLLTPFSQGITDAFITAMNKTWHKPCFVCSFCKKGFQKKFNSYQGKPAHTECIPDEDEEEEQK
jgi:hypothetical protein